MRPDGFKAKLVESKSIQVTGNTHRQTDILIYRMARYSRRKLYIKWLILGAVMHHDTQFQSAVMHHDTQLQSAVMHHGTQLTECRDASWYPTSKPEVLSGFETGNRIPHDEWNLRGIAHAHTYTEKTTFLCKDN